MAERLKARYYICTTTIFYGGSLKLAQLFDLTRHRLLLQPHGRVNSADSGAYHMSGLALDDQRIPLYTLAEGILNYLAEGILYFLTEGILYYLAEGILHYLAVVQAY